MIYVIIHILFPMMSFLVLYFSYFLVFRVLPMLAGPILSALRDWSIIYTRVEMFCAVSLSPVLMYVAFESQ